MIAFAVVVVIMSAMLRANLLDPSRLSINPFVAIAGAHPYCFKHVVDCGSSRRRRSERGGSGRDTITKRRLQLLILFVIAIASAFAGMSPNVRRGTSGSRALVTEESERHGHREMRRSSRRRAGYRHPAGSRHSLFSDALSSCRT